MPLPSHTGSGSAPAGHDNSREQFCKGNSTENRQQRTFTRVSIDESHEQNNAARVKDPGGTIGMTKAPTAWLI